MRLHGTIDRQELVKYLAKQYAHCSRSERRWKSQEIPKLADACYFEMVAYRAIIRDLRDGTI